MSGIWLREHGRNGNRKMVVVVSDSGALCVQWASLLVTLFPIIMCIFEFGLKKKWNSAKAGQEHKSHVIVMINWTIESYSYALLIIKSINTLKVSFNTIIYFRWNKKKRKKEAFDEFKKKKKLCDNKKHFRQLLPFRILPSALSFPF